MPPILEHQRRFFSRADAGRFAGRTDILIILGGAGFIRHGFGGRPATLAPQ